MVFFFPVSAKFDAKRVYAHIFLGGWAGYLDVTLARNDKAFSCNYMDFIHDQSFSTGLYSFLPMFYKNFSHSGRFIEAYLSAKLNHFTVYPLNHYSVRLGFL